MPPRPNLLLHYFSETQIFLLILHYLDNILSYCHSGARLGYVRGKKGWIDNFYRQGLTLTQITVYIFRDCNRTVSIGTVNSLPKASLRILYRVSIETQDLGPFCSVKKYRISSIVDTAKLWFCYFSSPKKSYCKAKNTHFWKFESPRLPPPLFRNNSSKKCLKKATYIDRYLRRLSLQ